jgi:3-hydroxymyristoyl/3-hydroxydecanoyl-(acyl carrier protein) dehydratase
MAPENVNPVDSVPAEGKAPLFQSAIQRVIPHRYPFLLVDRVTEFVPGERIAGIKTFTCNEPQAQGHFPGWPTVPAGILIEMVTQLGAILVLDRPHMQGKLAVILQIPEAKMMEPVAVGDSLRVEAEVVRIRQSFGELRGAAFRDGIRVAEGQMRFAIANLGDFLPQ